MSHDTGYDKYLIDMEIARLSNHCVYGIYKKKKCIDKQPVNGTVIFMF